MRNLTALFIFWLSLSCNPLHDKYYYILEGNWQITKMYHNDLDLMVEGFSIISFDQKTNFWLLRRLEGQNHFNNSNYKIYSDSAILKMDVKNCEDKRLEGDYNLYIDTIQQTENYYILQLTLDHENTYIQAIRQKLKKIYPPPAL